MQKPILDIKRMNEIIEKTVAAIDEGRQEIFDIAENARKECERIKNELDDLHERILTMINSVDRLERDEKRARSRLMMVSKNFNKYSEEDIRIAYEEANNARIRHILRKQEEKDLIQKRNELEVSLKKTFEIVKKAEKLVSQVGVAMEYLKGNLNDIFETIEDMSKRQYLGIRIIEAQEEERQRVAREIHDGPAQSMANVVLKAELCEKLLSLDISKAKDELKKLKEIIRGSLKDIRKIIYDLRPMSLDDLGLIPTIQRYTQNFTDETSIEVEMMVIGEQMEADSVVQIACFRIIQESLSNIRKHSRASRVMIKIENSTNKLSVIVKDNGIGFEMDKLHKSDNLSESGFGLIGMRERAELLNGKLEVISGHGDGTKIMLTIPLIRKDDIYEK